MQITKIFLALVVIVTLNTKIFSQVAEKKHVRIGLYINNKASLHSGLITMISRYYILQNRAYADGASTNKENKRKFDSTNVFELSFGVPANYTEIVLNKNLKATSNNGFNDTTFSVIVKEIIVSNKNYKQLLQQDSLNYLFYVSEISSDYNAKKEFDINYTYTIYSPEGKKSKVIKKVNLYNDENNFKKFVDADAGVQLLFTNFLSLSKDMVLFILKKGYNNLLFKEYKNQGLL